MGGGSGGRFGGFRVPLRQSRPSGAGLCPSGQAQVYWGAPRLTGGAGRQRKEQPPLSGGHRLRPAGKRGK